MPTHRETEYRLHREADARDATARKLVKLLLKSYDDFEYEPWVREFIKLGLWKVSEAEAGKYNTRYRSLRSLRKGARVQHDHVVERAKLADELVAAHRAADPERVDEILDRVIGCVVTKDEHRRLADISRLNPNLDGWERYAAAGIVVIDTMTGERMVIPDTNDDQVE